MGRSLFEVINSLKGIPDTKMALSTMGYKDEEMPTDISIYQSSLLRKPAREYSFPIKTLPMDIKCNPPDQALADARV